MVVLGVLGGSWCFFGGSWFFLVVLEVFSGLLWFLVFIGGYWQLLVVPGGSLWFFLVFGGT